MNDFAKKAYFNSVLEATFQKEAMMKNILGWGKDMIGGGLKDIGRAGSALFGANAKGQSAAYNLLKGIGTAARGVGRMALPVAGVGLAGYGALKAMQFAGRGAEPIDNWFIHRRARQAADRAASDHFRDRYSELGKERRRYADDVYKGSARDSAQKSYNKEYDTWF